MSFPPFHDDFEIRRQIPSGVTRFRTTSVKPYYQSENENVDERQREMTGPDEILDDREIPEGHEIPEHIDIARPISFTSPPSLSTGSAPHTSPPTTVQPAKRGRGRPRNSQCM